MSNVKGKRVAVLVEKFYEDLELWYPVLRLREAGCDVKIVGPKAGETYASKHGYPAKAEVAASEVKAATSTRSSFPAAIRPTTCAGTRRWSTWSPRRHGRGRSWRRSATAPGCSARPNASRAAR